MNKGFTLIELLIVIAAMCIIVTLVMKNWRNETNSPRYRAAPVDTVRNELYKKRINVGGSVYTIDNINFEIPGYRLIHAVNAKGEEVQMDYTAACLLLVKEDKDKVHPTIQVEKQ
jgi:prepilin-type N-terminal cleavage/methylation domain-containing protein